MVYYNRINLRGNRIPSGFTHGNTVCSSEALVKNNTRLASGLTVNSTATATSAVTVTPGAGG